MAVVGETAASIADAIMGSGNVYASISQLMSTSSGSRVLRDGTIATSSSPYALRPVLPMPISYSMRAYPRSLAAPRMQPETQDAHPLPDGRPPRMIEAYQPPTPPSPHARCP